MTKIPDVRPVWTCSLSEEEIRWFCNNRIRSVERIAPGSVRFHRILQYKDDKNKDHDPDGPKAMDFYYTQNVWDYVKVDPGAGNGIIKFTSAGEAAKTLLQNIASFDQRHMQDDDEGQLRTVYEWLKKKFGD